jgi:hypothetical protein
MYLNLKIMKRGKSNLTRQLVFLVSNRFNPSDLHPHFNLPVKENPVGKITILLEVKETTSSRKISTLAMKI